MPLPSIGTDRNDFVQSLKRKLSALHHSKESTGEVEAVAMSGKINIKEEPMLTDTDCQPFEEVEQIFIKEENVKLEIPDECDAVDPLQLETEECVAEQETTSLPCETYIKEELELQTEVQSTSFGNETESLLPVGVEDDNSFDCSGDLATSGGLATGTRSTIQCSSTKQVVFPKHKNGTHLIHSCTISKKTFSHSQDIKKHKQMDSHEFPHSCSVCHKTFTNNSYLKCHFCLHSEEHSYRCDVCYKTYKTKCHLKQHSVTHTDEYPFICEVCYKAYKFQSSLSKHSRLHTGERPYYCDVCPKTFKTSTCLKLHSRVHTGERPYKCEVCNKKFSCSSRLKEHSRVHIGLPPFTCGTCLKTSTENCRIKVQPKSFNCNFCHKKFMFPNGLTNHLLGHTGEPPVNCCVCNKPFTALSIRSQTLQLNSS